MANGINWAWRNGADIISNSWGGYANSGLIEDAIDSALVRGRNGTHVAGIAALVLSVNPALYEYQVRDIIESTARRVGGYNYHIEPGRNYLWHEEMGYGLVDAYEAVKKAQAVCTTPMVNFTNQTVTTNTTTASCGTINVQNVTVSNNAQLRLVAPGEVTINGPFEVQSGSQLEIK